MESVQKVASYIAKHYQTEFREQLSEMKLHKLLYFTQRESLIRFERPMFNESFFAWKYGPVIPSIRNLYAQNLLNELPDKNWIIANKSVLDFIFSHYAPKDAWSLSNLSYGELSWKRARKGLDPSENSDRDMKIADIMEDAKRIRWRRYINDLYNTKKQ